MAWLAVNADGQEIISPSRPVRCLYDSLDFWVDNEYVGADISLIITLPKGTIFKLLGKNMNWNDEPVELK